MSRIAASLAALIASVGFAACGGQGAEPDAPSDGVAMPVPLDLVLDFQPNAVHTGIYVAQERGLLTESGISLTVREPGASTDAPKLLRAGRADLAVIDIHDLAIAREAGADLIAIGAIVQRPLAAVIAADGAVVTEPADLEGLRIGVTGLPSDDAVLEAVLASAGLGLGDVRAVTIGFDSIAALSAGRLAAATAFWNAEGVIMRDQLGLPTREFRVDRFGAPPYPELVLATTSEALKTSGEPIAATVAAIGAGYAATVADSEAALSDLIAAVPSLDRESQRQQLEAVLPALRPAPLDREVLEAWADWALQHGIVASRPDVQAAFELELGD